MKFQKTLFGCLVGVALSMNVNAQEVQGFVHERSTDYEWPTDQQILDKLDKWQGPEIRCVIPLGALFGSGYCRVMVYLFRGCGLDFP